jgi:hypothetical protein
MREHTVGEMVAMLVGGSWTAAHGHIGEADQSSTTSRER